MKFLTFLMLLLAGRLHAVPGQGVTSANWSMSGSSIIGTYFMQNVPGWPNSPTTALSTTGASTQSLVFQNVDGGNYKHLMVLNTSHEPLQLLFTTNLQAIPNPNSTQMLYILSNGTGTFDDLPVWNNLYAASMNGQSVFDGTVQFMIWGK